MTAEDNHALDRLVGDAETVREVFEEMPQILIGWEGPEHTVIAVNERYRSLFGRSELVGIPLAEAMPELAGQAIVELLDRVYATGQVQVGREWRVQVKHEDTGQPQEAFVDFTMTPIPGADGRPTRLLAYATDVTENVRERQAAQEQVAEAQRRYEAARDVVAELQEALLPTGLPLLPAARIGARYLVAG